MKLRYIFILIVTAVLTACGGGSSSTEPADMSGGDSALPDLPRGVISTGARRVPIKQQIIDHPDIAGFMVLDSWDSVEPTEGVYNWTHIDAEVARAKAGNKVVRLAIHTGGESVPDWVYSNYPNVDTVIAYDKFTGSARWIPAYWDPEFIEIKRRFYEALGNRYKDEVAVFAISASMVDPNTGDFFFAADTDEQIQSYLDAGFTETRFVNAYKTLLDYAMTAFANKYVITAVGPIPVQLVNDSYSGLNQVLDYGYATYGSRLLIAKGSLNAGVPLATELPPAHHPWQTMLRYSPNAIGQFLYSVTDDFEYQMTQGIPYGEDQIEDVFWSAVEIGKSYNLRWIEPWSIDLLNPVLQDEIHAAALLLGSD